LSRNRDRLGSQNNPDPDSSPPAQLTQEQSNDSNGFAFVVPTEFVELPSKGRFYPERHPLHNQDTIEIKHMTAKEEDLLTSRALLKKGIVLDRLLDSIIVNKRIRSEQLLVGDRNAILIAARISGYGPDYQTQISCPACNTKQRYDFDLFDVEVYTGESLVPEEAVSIGNGLFTTVLPKTSLEITFRLLNGIDERNILSQIENARKAKKQENAVTRQLRSVLVAVNGSNAPDALNYVANNLPSLDARHLRKVIALATPNIDLTQHFECNSCDHEQELEVPLTADFFWPDQ